MNKNERIFKKNENFLKKRRREKEERGE